MSLNRLSEKNINVPHIRRIDPVAIEDMGMFDRLRLSMAGQVYVRHFKKYRTARLLVGWSWEYVYHLVNSVIRVLSLLRRRIYVLEAYEDRFSEVGIMPATYVSSRQVEISIPSIFPDVKKNEIGVPETSFFFPNIELHAFARSIVAGGTNMILNDEVILHHGLYDFLRDKTSEELHNRLAIKPRQGKACWLIKDPKPVRIETAASFVDACAGNYAHWLTEVLPRIALFCQDERFYKVPLIINDGLHKNIMESLFIVTGADREIIALPAGRCLEVEHLYVVSPTGYIPFGRRSKKITDHPHGVFSPDALDALVSKIKASFVCGDSSPKRILIRRNSGVRQVTNFDDIENLLVNKGFVVIEPEKLNFYEQVCLFSQADIVVGATGAALANLIFCKQSVRLVVLMSKHESMPYWYWLNMACTIECNISYVIGEIVSPINRGIHGDFYVAPEDVESAVDFHE